MGKAASNFTWETVGVAARRLGRNAGHLRKLCDYLFKQGMARRVEGGGKKWHWEIRSDVQLRDTRRAAKVGKTISVRVGGLTITVQGDCGIQINDGRVSIIDTAVVDGSTGDSAAFNRHLRGDRRAYKTGSKGRRSHPDGM
jgi:hypothetical protein